MSDSDDPFDNSEDDGDDTDELLTTSKKNDTKPIAKKKPGKSRLKKLKDTIPDADNGSDDESASGLVDSDQEDDSPPKKNAKPMTKREKMDALMAKRRAISGVDDASKSKRKRGTGDGTEKGYDSGDSYNSGEFQRNQDDDDFIDRDGEDEEALKEYDREQIFEDERPHSEDEEMVRKPQKSKKRSSTKRGPDQLSDADKADLNNPVTAAVVRMKKKKKVSLKFEELREIAVEFIGKMERAADEDDISIKERKPGMKKLKMLPTVLDMLANQEMTRPLLETDVLVIIKRWIQPMKNGSLGNVTIRRKLIDSVSNMSGESGIDTDDLKRSEFGKLVMTLFMHKDEAPDMKKKLNNLIQQWSRIIFKKSGDMRDLQNEQLRRRRDSSMTAISRAYASAEEPVEPRKKIASRKMDGDIGSVISKGVKQARDMGKNRVRIPYSKGFQYTVRPADVMGDVSDRKTRVMHVKDQRSTLHKKIMEKKRPTSKNARSANISIEGRATK